MSVSVSVSESVSVSVPESESVSVSVSVSVPESESESESVPESESESVCWISAERGGRDGGALPVLQRVPFPRRGPLLLVRPLLVQQLLRRSRL